VKFLISDDERQLDLLSDANIRLLQDGLEMPLVSRELTYAESADSEGRRRIRSKNQNAEGRVGVTISGTSDSHFWGNVDNLLEIVESCHRNRGSIVYQPPGGTLVNWDVESITVTGLPQQGIELRRRRQQAEITFEVQPYGRLTEVTLSSGGTIDGPIDDVTVENVPGQVDSFGLLTLTDASTQSRQFVEVGVQHDFNPSSPEPLLLTAGTMAGAGGTVTGLSGTGGTASRPTGAYTTSSGNSYTVRATVATSPAAIATTSARPHKGLWKVRARVQANQANALVRLAWRVGDGPFAQEQWRAIPNSSTWYDLDLGVIDIEQMTGTHSWEGRIEAEAQSSFVTIDLDTVSFIPCDTYARLRGASTPDTNTFALTASDSFSTLSGTLSGGTVEYTPSGTVTWSTSGTATADFTVDTTNDWLIRNQGGDSSITTGRFARVGNLTAVACTVSSKINMRETETMTAGVFLRYVDANNYLLARLRKYSDGFLGLASRIELVKRVSGTFTTIATYGNPFVAGYVFGWNTLKVSVDTSGNAVVTINYGFSDITAISVTDTALATAGVLASGGFGVYHANTSTANANDAFDDFQVTGLNAATLVNPVIFSGRSVDLSHQAALSQSSDGSRKNPTPIVEGNYLKLPPATRNSDKARIVVRARRDDVDAGFADTGLTDKVTATVKATPRVTLE
jgi:hypothetical protein